jgi:trans-aconitate 2-methyltransferase
MVSSDSAMRSDWNPELYRRFEDERTRPALDLLARVPLSRAARVVDVGCGPGNSTEILLERFPDANTLGVDSSEAMIESARARLPDCRFELGDLSTWQPTAPPDLIFANAVLQWVPEHESLLPRLFSALAPGGVLALQVPDNLDEASHRLMREVAADGPWSSAIGDAASVRSRILSVAEYYDLLAPRAAHVEIWRTAYQHPMTSASAIVDWLRATGLRPFIEPLALRERAAFLSEYEQRIAAAYSPRADGLRLLAFPRLVVVARRAASA